jgi:hypothetical protein
VASIFTAAVLCGSGCGKQDAEKDKGGSGTPADKTESGTPPKMDLAKAKADFTMDADAWQAEWKKDREAAMKKYKGKIVELTGVVDKPSDDPYCKVGYIWLKVKKDILGPRCALDDPAPWLKVGPGCTIKIKGVVPDFGLSGDLYPCAIVESSPNTGLAITAGQLAKDFAADKKAAEGKYHNKWLIVEGELTGKEPSKIDEGRFVYLTLKGDGDVSVRCYVANNTDELKKANESLKVGQKVKVCGEAQIYSSEKGPQISCRGGRMVTVVN